MAGRSGERSRRDILHTKTKEAKVSRRGGGGAADIFILLYSVFYVFQTDEEVEKWPNAAATRNTENTGTRTGHLAGDSVAGEIAEQCSGPDCKNCRPSYGKNEFLQYLSMD